MATTPEKVALDVPKTPRYETTEALIKDLLLKESVEVLKPRFETSQIKNTIIHIMWDIVELYLSHYEENVASFIPPYKLPKKTLSNLVALAQKHRKVMEAISLQAIWEHRTMTDAEIRKHFETYQVEEQYSDALLHKIRDELTFYPHGRLIFPVLSFSSVSSPRESTWDPSERPDPDAMIRFLMSLMRVGKTDEDIRAWLHELKLPCELSWLEEARRRINPFADQLVMPVLPLNHLSVALPPPPPYAHVDPLSPPTDQLALLTEEVRCLRESLMNVHGGASSSSSVPPLFSPVRFSHPATPTHESPTTSVNCAEDFIRFILDNDSYRDHFKHDPQESNSALDERISRFAVQQLSKTIHLTPAKADEIRVLQALERKWQKAQDKTIDDIYQIICDDPRYFSRFQRINEHEQLEDKEDTELRLLWLIKFCVKKVSLPQDIVLDHQEIETIQSIISEVNTNPKLRRASSTKSF